MNTANSKTIAILGCAYLAVALIVVGCSTANPSAASAPGKTGGTTAVSGSVNGAQLWARNCGHCHNIRSPSSYSDAQWDVAMLHMRIRANLTADEHKAILAFLKSAH